MYNRHNSLTSRQEITQNGLICPYNQSINQSNLALEMNFQFGKQEKVTWN